MARKTAGAFFFAACLIVFTCVIIIFPEETASSVKEALLLCGNSVIPSLFPFFIISGLITSVDLRAFCQKYLRRITKPLFGIDGGVSPALLLGLIGGYPIGAATCTSAYLQKLCTKDEAERALAFCNNCGPAFILGAVGGGIFGSAKDGLWLLAIHIFAAIFSGILFRTFSPPCHSFSLPHSNEQKPFSFPKAFTASVGKALSSSLSISAYIVLFSVLVKALDLLCIFSLIGYGAETLFGADKQIAEAFCSGLFEMTVGSFSLAECTDASTLFTLISFLLGWGGLSVHCQALSFIADTDLSTRRYFIGKLMHGALSALLAYIYTRFAAIDAISVFSDNAASYAEAGARGGFLIILCLFYFFCKKGWKKVK